MCLNVWAIYRNIKFLRALQYRNTGAPLFFTGDPNTHKHTHINASVCELIVFTFLAWKIKFETHVNKQKLEIVEYFATTSLLLSNKNQKPRSERKKQETPFWHSVCQDIGNMYHMIMPALLAAATRQQAPAVPSNAPVMLFNPIAVSTASTQLEAVFNNRFIVTRKFSINSNTYYWHFSAVTSVIFK